MTTARCREFDEQAVSSTFFRDGRLECFTCAFCCPIYVLVFPCMFYRRHLKIGCDDGQSYIVDGCDVLDGTSAKPLYTTDIQDLSKSGLSRKAVLVRDAETGLEIPLMPIPDASGPSSFCSRRAVVDGHTFEWHTSSPEGWVLIERGEKAWRRLLARGDKGVFSWKVDIVQSAVGIPPLLILCTYLVMRRLDQIWGQMGSAERAAMTEIAAI